MLNTKRGGRPRNFVTPQAVEMTEPWKRWKSQTAAGPSEANDKNPVKPGALQIPAQSLKRIAGSVAGRV